MTQAKITERKPLPMQPIVKDELGRDRFLPNAIVAHLLAWATERGFGMNELAREGFEREDWVQFSQLIGYSVSGFSELSYVSSFDADAAQVVVETGADPRDARIFVLEDKWKTLRAALAVPLSDLFEVHPDDLRGER